MRAVSAVFDKIWNCLNPKAAREFIKWSLRSLPSYLSQFTPFLIYSSRLTDTHHHDHCSRPLNQPSPQPASTHTRNLFLLPFPLSPFLFIIICFPDIPPAVQLSPPCFHDRFYQKNFRFLCLFLPTPSHPLVLVLPPVSAPAYQAIIVDIIPRGSASITFSDPSKLALARSAGTSELTGIPKQYAAWANT